MVLSALVGEFRLQKKIGAGHDAGAIGRGQTLADSGFEVMLALVGGVDGAKAHAQGEFGESRGAVFLPGSAVEKIGRDEGIRHCATKTFNHGGHRGSQERSRTPVSSVSSVVEVSSRR